LPEKDPGRILHKWLAARLTGIRFPATVKRRLMKLSEKEHIMNSMRNIGNISNAAGNAGT
jgi:hypothetical protein